MNNIFKALILFCMCFNVCVNCLNNTKNVTFIEQNWIQIFNSLKTSFDINGKQIVNEIRNYEKELNISPICANNLIRMIENMSREEWAAKMLDSSGHLPSGVLSGTITEFGDFDQCIRISESLDEYNRIEGKYCFMTIRPIREQKFSSIRLNTTQIISNWFEKEVNDWLESDNFIPFVNGICFPSDCDKHEIKLLLNKVFKVLSNFDFDVNYCQTSREPTYRSELYIALFLIELMLVLLVIGSILDICSATDIYVVRLLKCFSILKNIKILFKISALKQSNEYRLQFIHGIRVLGTLWVILAHSSAFILVSILIKVSPFARYPTDAIENSKSLLSQYIVNASLAVQIFFTMSGFLTVYTTLSKKKLELSFFQFILLRWLRFTPPLIGMICFTLSLEMLGSGPLFQTDLLKPFLDPCYDNWWAHLLYLINWFDLRQMCGIQTWYLSADFQLHILSFVVIYFFYKNQTISRLYSYLMIILGALIPILLVGLGGFGIPRVDVLFKPKYELPGWETTLFFFGTHMHLISYFFGSIIGFALLNKKFISITKTWNTIVWLVVIVLTITLPLLTYPILQEDIHPVNYTIGNAIMIALLLIMWSLCMTWIIYNCAISRAGILPKILSANFLLPLSRLSFSAYLMHLMLIWFNVQQVRHPIHTNVSTIAQYFCTIVVETFAAAFLLYLTFEAPFVNLIKLIFIGDKTTQMRTIAQEDEQDQSVNSQNTININLKNRNTNNNNNE